MNILIETGREQGFRSLESVTTSVLCQSPNKPLQSYQWVFAQPCPAQSPSPPFRAPPLFFAPTQTLNLQDNPIWPSSCQDWSRQAAAVFPRGDAKLSTESLTWATRSVFPLFLCLSSSITLSSLSLGLQISHSHVFTPPSPLSRFCAQGHFTTVGFLTVQALWHRSRVSVWEREDRTIISGEFWLKWITQEMELNGVVIWQKNPNVWQRFYGFWN